MGRVKSQMIKKAARQLHEQVEDFNEDFNHNKKLLKGTIPYKSVRNRVAGGIVRLAKQMKMKKLREHKKKTEDDGRTEEDN
jgi:ribosomal protein S17E